MNATLQYERLSKINKILYVDKKLSDELSADSLQNQSIFSEKWSQLPDASNDDNQEGWKSFQFDWFLKLYGFTSEDDVSDYVNSLSSSPALLDAGCGKGYKTAWLSLLNKNSTVIGVDFSTALRAASERYSTQKHNVQFIQANIESLPVNNSSYDLILCDQVLHHTKDPRQTLIEFFRVLKPGGKLLTYVYRKKAVPRELIDCYFRDAVHGLSKEQLSEVAKGMTEIGKILSENDIELEFPDIKCLNIKGGKQSLQRYIYWNFFKCFWNENFGYEASLSTNYDWYSPSIAYRYSKEEFLSLIEGTGFTIEFLHEEEACFSGRFVKPFS